MSLHEPSDKFLPLPHDTQYDQQLHALGQSAFFATIEEGNPDVAAQLDRDACSALVTDSQAENSYLYVVDKGTQSVVAQIAYRVALAQRGRMEVSQGYVEPAHRHGGLASCLLRTLRYEGRLSGPQGSGFEEVAHAEFTTYNSLYDHRRHNTRSYSSSRFPITTAPLIHLSRNMDSLSTFELKLPGHNGASVPINVFSYLADLSGQSFRDPAFPEGYAMHRKFGHLDFPGTPHRNMGVLKMCLGKEQKVSGSCFGVPCTIEVVDGDDSNFNTDELDRIPEPFKSEMQAADDGFRCRVTFGDSEPIPMAFHLTTPKLDDIVPSLVKPTLVGLTDRDVSSAYFKKHSPLVTICDALEFFSPS